MKLCQVTLTTEYIKRRNNLLQGDTLINSFFIKNRKPNRVVHRDTIARWTKSIMKESDVDTKIFKAHSSRSASTSAATNTGVAIDDILKQGNRANASTFYKHYFNSFTTEADII